MAFTAIGNFLPKEDPVKVDDMIAANRSLTSDEKQLLVYLAWLTRSVNDDERERAFRSLNARLRRSQLDHASFMNELDQAITQFEPLEA